MQYSVSLLLSFNFPNYYSLTMMKRNSLTMNNPHFLLYWITCDFYLENKMGKISETSRNPSPWRNYLYLAPALFPPPLFSVPGIRMQENFFQNFCNRNITAYYYDYRVPKQSFNTKLHWQEHFHEAMLLIWLEDFPVYKISDINTLKVL